MQDFLKLMLLVSQLLGMRVALYSRDFMVWLALSGGFRVVPLAFVRAVAVVALGEALVLLVLWVGPSLHHVAELHHNLGVVAAEVVVDVLRVRPFWQQWMMSSVMLAMVVRISKKCLV
jgi:hypothetical protein